MSLPPPPKIPIEKLKLDSGLQIREGINEATVSEYAELMRDGVQFPPVDVYLDSEKYFLADGWHRVEAAKKNGEPKIAARVHKSRREALKHALKTNTTHGLPLTNADKRRGIELALREWPNLSSREIGRMCGVDHKTVETARSELGKFSSKPRIGADGKVRKKPMTRYSPATVVWMRHKKEAANILVRVSTIEGNLRKAKGIDMFWDQVDLDAALSLLKEIRALLLVPRHPLYKSKTPPAPKQKS